MAVTIPGRLVWCDEGGYLSYGLRSAHRAAIKTIADEYHEWDASDLPSG